MTETEKNVLCNEQDKKNTRNRGCFFCRSILVFATRQDRQNRGRRRIWENSGVKEFKTTNIRRLGLLFD